MSVNTSMASINLNVWDRASLDSTLDAAVEKLSGSARAAKCGILVTRKGVHDFTVSVNNAVPFGMTMEQDRWWGSRAVTVADSAGDRALLT